MRFKPWLESQELLSLRNHLKNPYVDIVGHAWDFLSWGKDVMRRLKINPKLFRQEMEEGGDKFYTWANQIEKAMTPNEIQNFIEYIARHNPGDTPSHALMDLQKSRGRKGFLPPSTWLVHFTDEAHNVKNKGFVFGQDQMDKLALTTHQSKAEKQYGGYNFAFFADSKYARQAANTGKYGKEAVMFMASGIPVYHSSDEEEQVIFWGKDVPLDRMVVVTSNYDEWTVNASRGKRNEVFKGKFADCVSWVMTHFNQYRRML